MQSNIRQNQLTLVQFSHHLRHRFLQIKRQLASQSGFDFLGTELGTAGQPHSIGGAATVPGNTRRKMPPPAREWRLPIP
jgi:hypothetical protein